ncbi:MAG: hypothetical protein K5663_10095 [Clostridiales bacterium]|nr:hypothetical protein [Clostridiales bacterium]
MSSDVIRILKGELTDYRPVPFWSWNDELEPKELRRQINHMKRDGFGGFFMHARGGLVTEYMGEDWFKCVAACVDESQKRDMRAWAYDENGWPSGFAGMKLLEDPSNHAHYLEGIEKDGYDPNALGCYRVENGELFKLNEDDGGKCFCVYDRTNPTVVDVLNWKIVQKFILETHSRYLKKLGQDFGKTMLGFFTDEPQYFRGATAYTPVINARYQSRFSEDITLKLGALFLDCREAASFRYRYWLMMNELFTESFAGQVYRWCEEHNCKLTGHVVEEQHLAGQMEGCAGVMPFYEYEHIPGVDWLGREIGSELTPRQVSSVAMQLGKKQVLTESFAACGWDVTPRELKRILEWQFVNGVNLVCHHLYPYSVRGQRKRDYPAFYSPVTSWNMHMRRFNDYFARLGYLLAESREMADTLVIHPLHAGYTLYKRLDRNSTAALNASFVELVEKLGARGVIHHIGDETLMKKYGRVAGRKLVIGKCAYSTVVVPEMPSIDESTLRLLKEFVKNGGRLCLAGNAPTLVNGEEKPLDIRGNIGLDDISNPGFALTGKSESIRITVRRAEFGDFIFAVNLSKDTAQHNSFKIRAQGARKLNLEALRFEDIPFSRSEGGIEIPLDLEAGESEVIFLSARAMSAEEEKKGYVRTISSPGALITKADTNTLPLDTARLSFDGESYTEEIPVMAINDRLLKEQINRTVYLKYTFRANAKPSPLRLEAETGGEQLITVNGCEVSPDREGDFGTGFMSYDISGLVRMGTNEIVLRMDYYQSEHVYRVHNGVYFEHDNTTESLVNCLCYETNIENVYLRGDFCVEMAALEPAEKRCFNASGFAVTLPRRYVNASTLAQDGFPFFGGTLRLSLNIDAQGTEKWLRLNGRYAAARIAVNGGPAKTLLLSDKVDVEGEVKRGVNTLEIELTSSLRNVFGPFHQKKDPEPNFTSPNSFTHYGAWQDGRWEGYQDEYAIKFFGIDSVELW